MSLPPPLARKLFKLFMMLNHLSGDDNMGGRFNRRFRGRIGGDRRPELSGDLGDRRPELSGDFGDRRPELSGDFGDRRPELSGHGPKRPGQGFGDRIGNKLGQKMKKTEKSTDAVQNELLTP